MADFTESLINNVDVHSPMPSINMGQLGEKLRLARTSTIDYLSQALKKTTTTAPVKEVTPVEKVSAPAPVQVSGKLEINIVEGRNLTIADAMTSDTYCVVYYENKSTSTLDKSEEDILPPLESNTDKQSANDAFKAFEIMMSASSPKWMHRVTFDVAKGNNEISVYVYDRGNKLPNGEDRFLGMSSIKPNLVSDKFVELVFPLHGRPGDDEKEITGDVRLQVTYTNTKKTRRTKKLSKHPLNVAPEDEDPEVDFWFRK